MSGGRPRDGTPDGFRLPRSARIRRTKDIRALFGRGKRRRTDHLDVFFAASPVSRPRWGVVVPKYGRSIVERNRLRRRLRHVGRTRVMPRLWEEGRAIDFMVRARKGAYEAPYEALEAELVGLTEELCSEASSSG